MRFGSASPCHPELSRTPLTRSSLPSHRFIRQSKCRTRAISISRRWARLSSSRTARVRAGIASVTWLRRTGARDDLVQHAVTAHRNGEVVGTGSGANVLGDPRVALTWLVNELSTHGRGRRRRRRGDDRHVRGAGHRQSGRPCPYGFRSRTAPSRSRSPEFSARVEYPPAKGRVPRFQGSRVLKGRTLRCTGSMNRGSRLLASRSSSRSRLTSRVGAQAYPPRPAAPADVVERGKALYSLHCALCHGADARGNAGPSLLRSELVLKDQKGELIAEVLQKGRPERGMPAFAQLTPANATDIAAYIHSFPVGSRDPARMRPPTIVVGDSSAGSASLARSAGRVTRRRVT